MESEFKPGDAVVLKSGGPGMTVLDVGRHTGAVLCQWIDDGDVCESAFPPVALLVDRRDHFH